MHLRGKNDRHCNVTVLCLKLQKRYDRPGRPRRKKFKREHAGRDFEQDGMGSTSNVAGGDVNVDENSREDNIAVSQSFALDDEETFGSKDNGDDEYFPETSSGGSRSQRAETKCRRSSVWKYFIRQDTSALCKVCQKSLKRSVGNTTNLIQHLKRTHSKEYRAVVMENSHRKMEDASRHMVCCVTAHTY